MDVDVVNVVDKEFIRQRVLTNEKKNLRKDINYDVIEWMRKKSGDDKQSIAENTDFVGNIIKGKVIIEIIDGKILIME